MGLEIKYRLLCLLVVVGLGVVQAVEGPGKNQVAEEFQACQKAKTRGDCLSSGCTFDCHMRTCLPLEYACLMDSTNKCFHLCNDKETCETVNECAYEDSTDTCSNTELLADPIRQGITLNPDKETWMFDQNCKKRCVAKSQDVFSNVACKKPPSTKALCSKETTHKSACCKRITSVTTTPRSIGAIGSNETVSEFPLIQSTTELSTTLGPSGTGSTSIPTPAADPVAPLCRSYSTSEDCRKHRDCAYSCDTRKCLPKDQVLKKCSRGCASFCQDPCGCKGHAGGKCEYHVVSGECIPRQPECPKSTFEGTECGRSRSFYASAGVLCYNEHERGDCEVEENVLAVNLNGRRQRDKRGIDYYADYEISFTDFYSTRRKFYFPHAQLNDADKYLFEGFVLGQSMGMGKPQCLTYSVPLLENGRYELAIRLFEPLARRVARRMFDVFFHDELVIPNLDIYALVGQNIPASIVVNFNVSTDTAEPTAKRISIKGHPKKMFMNTVQLAFCQGDCRFDKRFFWEIGSYLASAFSVVRF